MILPSQGALKNPLERIYLARGHSAYGRYMLAAGDSGIFHLEFERTPAGNRLERMMEAWQGRIAEVEFPYPRALHWLDDYFRGEPGPFQAPLDLRSGTPFLRSVWEEVFNIPYGRITTYSGLASRVGTPSPRAVGTANGRNPLPLIIPCHRVVRRDGYLGGYEYGMDMKIRLLEVEGVPLIQSPRGARVSPDFLMESLPDGGK